MQRARRHQRFLSGLAFGLLALVVELGGRSLTHTFDFGRHVASPGNTRADYYPILLATVKVGIALLLARLVWRVVRARLAQRAGEGVLSALGARHVPGAPRVRLSVTPRLWLSFFATTALFYLAQVDAEGASDGRWPLLGPWLHSSALPVFAVLAVLAALVWSVVARWLGDYERYVEATVAYAVRLAGRRTPRLARPRVPLDRPPRRLFGLVFESRPPPPLA